MELFQVSDVPLEKLCIGCQNLNLEQRRIQEPFCLLNFQIDLSQEVIQDFILLSEIIFQPKFLNLGTYMLTPNL